MNESLTFCHVAYVQIPYTYADANKVVQNFNSKEHVILKGDVINCLKRDSLDEVSPGCPLERNRAVNKPRKLRSNPSFHFSLTDFFVLFLSNIFQSPLSEMLFFFLFFET